MNSPKNSITIVKHPSGHGYIRKETEYMPPYRPDEKTFSKSKYSPKDPKKKKEE